MTVLPTGLIAPNLTPFDNDSSVALDLYVEHARHLLDTGCGGLAPFGTTGESLSVGLDERVTAVDALLRGGVPADRLIVGTGLTNLPDTLRLTRHAMDVGAAAAMVLPPFYFKNPPDDGLHHYFEALIEAMNGAVRIVLYHIPQIAGVGFSCDLVARLRSDFPDQILAIKDSSGDWTNTEQLFGIEGLTVYPGSELPMIDALELGGRELISATANYNSTAIIDVLRNWTEGHQASARSAHQRVSSVRRCFVEYAPIPAQKRLLAMSTGDSRWANVRPPLLPLSPAAGATLAEELAALR